MHHDGTNDERMRKHVNLVLELGHDNERNGAYKQAFGLTLVAKPSFSGIHET